MCKRARVFQLCSACFLRLAILIPFLLVSFVGESLAQQQQPPVGKWTFSEGNGVTAADSSGNHHTAALKNGVSWVDTPIGGGIAADAAARQYVSIPAIDLTGSKAVTVALWVNRQYSPSGEAVLIDTTTASLQPTTGFTVYADSAICGGLQASLRGNGGYTSNCYSQPTSGVWHHLAVVFDRSKTGGDQVALYIDGVLRIPNWNLQSVANTSNFGKNPISLLAQDGIANFTSAEVTDLRIYNAALDANEISNIYEEDATQLSPSFDVSVYPYAVSAPQGGQATTTVTTTVTGGYNGDLMLSTTGVPDGTTVSFSSDPIPPPGAGTATMTINVGAGTAQGFYKMSVMGSGGGMQSVATVALTVIEVPKVALSWDASLSQVIGYNVYRSLTTGGPYTKVNTDLVPGTTYLDVAVQHGVTYYYVATAVDDQQQESVYSNEASASVP